MAEEQISDFVTALDQISRQLTERREAGQETTEELIRQQMLFERWVKQEEWDLRRVALPLLLAIDPEEWDTLLQSEALAAAETALWELVEQAGAEGVLPLLNPGEASAFWRVRPRDIYLWARARGIALPAVFDRLMSFVISAVPVEEETGTPEIPPAVAPPGEREIVLGAALALLANVPASCRDESGWVTGTALAHQILAKQALWFERPPRMNLEEMSRWLDQWLDSMGGDLELPF